MSRLRQSDDGWDAGNVRATAVMVAAGRAAETGPGGDKHR
jgi:O-methyltransferase involved in polyketide biosynthesis